MNEEIVVRLKLNKIERRLLSDILTEYEQKTLLEIRKFPECNTYKLQLRRSEAIHKQVWGNVK